MVSVGVVGDAVTVEDGDLVYPDVEESTVGLDIDVLPCSWGTRCYRRT